MKTFKKIWNVVSTIIVVLVVILALALVGVRLFGFQVYSVLSGSMEPTYSTGSLLYVKKVDPADVRVGDVITFMLDENTVATHRVTEVMPDEDEPGIYRYFTKGDANEYADQKSVHSNNLLGTPVFSIPYLGYVANYIQHPPGLYIAISAGAVLLLLVFVPDLFDDDKKNNKKKELSSENADEKS